MNNTDNTSEKVGIIEKDDNEKTNYDQLVPKEYMIKVETEEFMKFVQVRSDVLIMKYKKYLTTN